MQHLETADPHNWQLLCDGGLSTVRKSSVPCTELWLDQALEQCNKELKSTGQIIGLTQHDDTLNRLTTVVPYITELLKQYFDRFAPAATGEQRQEHHHCSGKIAERTLKNSKHLSFFYKKPLLWQPLCCTNAFEEYNDRASGRGKHSN